MDEEKSVVVICFESVQWSRFFLDMVYYVLDSLDDDYYVLFVFCFFYVMFYNKGIDFEKLE